MGLKTNWATPLTVAGGSTRWAVIELDEDTGAVFVGRTTPSHSDALKTAKHLEAAHPGRRVRVVHVKVVRNATSWFPDDTVHRRLAEYDAWLREQPPTTDATGANDAGKQ